MIASRSTFRKTMVGLVMAALMAPALYFGGIGGCGGGGDGGKAKCDEWVALYNALECVPSDEEIDAETSCPQAAFDAAASAGCTWDSYYQSCIDSAECTVDGDATFPTHDCEGTCE
jgi:hypothetical protein